MDIDLMIEEINGKIAVHEAEIAKLKGALGVILKIVGKPTGTAKETKQLAAPKKPSGPLFTVTKAKPASEKPPRAPRGEIDWKDTVRNVIAASAKPLKSGDIVDMLNLRGDSVEEKRKKQAVYNALSTMSLSGALQKDSEGRFSLIKPVGAADPLPPKENESAEAA